MDASVDARLRADGVAFTAADAALLRAIDEAGSVSGATDRLGRSRARALDRVATLEDAFGPLVERTRGGAGGGGSTLTADARDLLARFDRLRAALAGTADTDESVLRGTLTERRGELGVVATDAGEIRARLVGDPAGDSAGNSAGGSAGDSAGDSTVGSAGDSAGHGETATVGSAVQVGVRSDAVTLHAPADAPAPDATSARNRFEGTVVDVDRGTAVARVYVDVGWPDPLVALLTVESLDRLELATGSPIVASFKATATRAIPDVRPPEE